MTATIRMMPPIPESDRARFESVCDDCGTHEGTFTDPDDPRLLQLRDRHNSLHVMPYGRIVRITDPAVDYGAHVRPLDWMGYGEPVIGTEDMGDGWVKLLWRCDPGDQPPDAYTMFCHNELVEVAP